MATKKKTKRVPAPKLVQFADEGIPSQLLPHKTAAGEDAAAVLLLKRDPAGKRMKEALCAWGEWAPRVEFEPEAGATYWAFWFKGRRKPSEAELETWLHWSEGPPVPIDLNPPPVVVDGYAQ
jgi:hypothetical protein